MVPDIEVKSTQKSLLLHLVIDISSLGMFSGDITSTKNQEHRCSLDVGRGMLSMKSSNSSGSFWILIMLPLMPVLFFPVIRSIVMCPMTQDSIMFSIRVVLSR
jgi:hypothetical protein